ncbi:DNA ligase 4 [Laetiporus sulphureus 93-53]|uniref:DNA ligase n=1 Tax=Laetiporus sulphureus 93-53 TaxID=1314785 RepID=A0A165GBA0_9APHY|nr:DNA ligase 4 [Laetiporus sulphureus 93-53]KZT10103.1 DNA ligase 4 [Laetiporus sulphureus 93-53]
MLPTASPPSPPPSPPSSPPTAETAVPEDHNIIYPAPPQNRGTAPFQVLAILFDKLQHERKPEKRRRLLDSWFNHWRGEKGYDLYPVLRLILPQKDRERAVYGLKEKFLAKTFIKLIPLGTRDPDAIRLLNWKKPTERNKSSGDFPTVLYEVISKRSSVIEGSLTIDELNDLLDELAQNIGKHDVQARIMQRIYNRTTPEEQCWIVRIILKDMQISVKETTVFSVFHPDAHDLFNTCSDLKKIAWELWDPKRRLNEEDKAVQLFRAFAPMLCKRPTRKIEDSVKEMQGRTFIMEEKLDGERMQLHKRGNEYFYCSRKGKDYTYLYGKHVGTGSLTPYLHNAFDPRVDEIILDGEMLVWDPVSERNLPFGSLKTAALDKSKKEHNPRPCFKVFDILFLNGVSLLHKSLKYRKRNLKSCLQEVPGRVEYVKEYEGRTAKDVRERMDEIMANRGEGLILKHPDSEYVLNGRNRDWIKVKPEYMDNMGETVDVLVVSGNYGTGRRAGGVSTFVCAVLDDRRPNDEDEPKYSTLVRVGTGLSYADYVWVRSLPWKEWNPKDPPSFIEVSSKGAEDKGDVYIEPQDSFILKVKAAEIVSSDLYHMGVTMRFPRALQIRDDLEISDCMTATAVLDSLRSERKRKMEDDDGKPKKKQRKTKKKITLLPEYQSLKLKDVEVQSDLFEGMKLMVASDPKSRTGDEDKKELLKLIRANGGSFVQIARDDPQVLVVYGGTTTPYDIKLIKDKGVCDIIKPQWILNCCNRGERVPMKKKYFFYATPGRTQNEEYNMEDESEEEEVPCGSSEVASEMTPEQQSEKGKAEEEKLDPTTAEWFHVEAAPSRSEASSETEIETEADSDNEDVHDEEQDVDEDWVDVEPSDVSASQSVQKTSAKLKDTSLKETEVKMGEDENAMQYDQDLIFKHLCFYLDSPENARKHGMVVRAKNEQEISRSFEKLAAIIIANGGRVVELDEPKLTHVIVDKRDISRRVELIKRTSKPKRRHLVIAEFIQACLDEATLLDEDEFGP